MLEITVIGINDSDPVFTEEQENLISVCSFFAGGKRHYQLVKGLLPENHVWTNITVPLFDLFDEINKTNGNWIIFASGDPWFFGIANTLKREFYNASINVFPIFNSLQTLGHRLGVNYGEYKTITLTGRSWHEFDKALITGEHQMGVLTDKKKTPATIAERMLSYGYSNYTMLYGEHLGGELEKVIRLSLSDALTLEFKHPNCLFLEKTDNKTPQKMIHEKDFHLLNDRPNMTTKLPTRLSSLASMKLNTKTVFWDIGACTGSVSIEARLNYPHLKITAFEFHEKRMHVLTDNTKRFQAPGIELFTGDYLSINKENLERPDAVFLGGYNGAMEKILNDVAQRLQPHGTITFNSVSETSLNRFLDWTSTNNFDVCFQQSICADAHNPIEIITIEKKYK